MKAAAAQWIGCRSKQEDAYRIRFLREGVVAVVCDGMGGHHHGAAAADTAAASFVAAFAASSSVPVSERMTQALESANQAVGRLAEESSQYGGTTLVAAYIGAGVVRWISVGDSALFLWRRGRLVRLNADHSMRPLLNGLVKSCSDTRNMLRSALTGEPPELVDIAATPIPLLPDDRLILCTDGAEGVLIPGQVSDSVQKVLTSRTGKEASELMELICHAGLPGADNATILVVDV